MISYLRGYERNRMRELAASQRRSTNLKIEQEMKRMIEPKVHSFEAFNKEPPEERISDIRLIEI